MTWNTKLITPGEALTRTGRWPLRIGHRKDGSVHLECARCAQSAGLLSDGKGSGTGKVGSWTVTTEELVSAVLRHMVMAHNEPLGDHGG